LCRRVTTATITTATITTATITATITTTAVTATPGEGEHNYDCWHHHKV